MSETEPVAPEQNRNMITDVDTNANTNTDTFTASTGISVSASAEVAVTAKDSSAVAISLAEDFDDEVIDEASETDKASEDVMSEDEMSEIEVTEETFEIEENAPPLLDMATRPPAGVCFDGEFLAELDRVPDRLAFKIGDVANIVGIKQYVLRYWETEFEELRPKKSKNNQRIYTRKDVENVLLIKKLLYRDRYSIEGARAMLRQSKAGLKQEKEWKAIGEKHHNLCDRLKDIAQEIRTLRERLNTTYLRS